ncbi:PAS domain-containing protein [Pseudomonas sp. nanlin1]|uniref:PAS domain-containing hybrid sensor histidine kinase/response regulator n=1 Tax=Pseudomonas sp. nanlin1 TaxID=3040605 RepID=UPI00388F1858
MGATLRATDWSASPLGAFDQWPATLRATLRLMLVSTQSQYLAWGPEQLLFFNDAYRPLLGDRLDGALGKPLRSVLPEAWVALQPLLQQAQSGQAVEVDELQVSIIRDGENQETYWSLACSPIYDERELCVLGVLCTTRETTHARRLEAELRDIQAFNARVLASSNDCIKVLDLDGKLTFMSDGGMRVMEVSDFNAIRGCPWPDFWQAQGNIDATAALAGARLGISGRFQGAADTYLGTTKWWDVQVTPIMDSQGRPEKILCISRDITATREAEEELRRLNLTLIERVQTRTQDRDRLWQLSTDLMLVADFSGHIFAANPAWSHALGWDHEELIGHSFVDLLHPDDCEDTAVAAADLARGDSVQNFENRYRHKDGSYRWISWTAVPDRDYIHAIGRDIQAEREAAEALRKTEEALHQSQKLEAIGQLTGGVAHDFNNLLTVIKSSTYLLGRSLDETRRAHYIEAISDTVDRASRLTSQLLAFARRQALRPETFDVGRSVKSIGEMIGTLIGARINVHIELPQQACYIKADAGQFDTALVNMAVNARDAMDGEGQLKLSVRPVVGLPANAGRAQQPGEYVAVSLTDTGSGIGEEQMQHIFEPFFTTKEVGKGTGLGLSQVFGFAKQSGGEVTVDSSIGGGTTFTLYLPRTSPDGVVELPAHPDDDASDGAGAYILVVEDNPEVGEFSTHTLRELGYKTHWVKTAAAALTLLAQEPKQFQAVFSDVVMPGMNGIALAEQIQQRFPGLAVVLTSGYSPTLMQGSTHTFVQKPYSAQALAYALRTAIRAQ